MEENDIVSEPAYREETVTDLDFSYPSGLCQLTLREGDTVTLVSDSFDEGVYFQVHKQARGTYPEEDIVLYTDQLEWRSTRTRVMKWPLKKPVTVQPDSHSPSADSTGEP